MKKSLLALVVLGSFAGVASAANSVTLYGTAEIAYQKDGGVWQDLKGTNGGFRQDAAGESRVGFKGTEDLGNGMAAFFQMEARFNLDTGANTGTVDGTGFFDEKSVVGLSFANGEHSVYFGKAPSPIDRLGNNVGHLHADMGTFQSRGGWRNGAFYDYSKNGLLVAAAVTTKGGVVDNTNEGATGEKSSYGLSAKYTASNWSFGAGWQADHAEVKNEWKVVGSYTFNPVTIGATYASSKGGTGYGFDKGRTIQAHIAFDVTSRDNVHLTYFNGKQNGGSFTSTAGTSGYDTWKLTKYALGYKHSLSKRTSVFASVARAKLSYSDAALGSTSKSGTGWDMGIKHTF
jgi:general bacterial porin, GBP family